MFLERFILKELVTVETFAPAMAVALTFLLILVCYMIMPCTGTPIMFHFVDVAVGG
jgi:hypothetical protein